MMIFIAFVSVVLANAYAGCPEGYVYYAGDNTCLKSVNEAKTAIVAQQDCENENAKLVQVYDALKTEFIGGIQPNSYWTGVRDLDGRRNFGYFDKSPLGYYQPWAKGAPNPAGNREYCVYAIGTKEANGGQWDDASCFDRKPFVCEKSRCAEGFTFYGPDQTCIKYFADPKHYFDAKKTCVDQGGDLVQVRNPVKALFVSGLLSGDYWTGVWDVKKDRLFRFADESPLGSYKPWTGAPDPSTRSRKYCVFSSQNGQWTDDSCTVTRPYVCEN